MNVLFICSKNEWRSRTAETIFRDDNRFSVKSAGTSKTARIRVNSNHIAWAERIFVMEDKHKKRLFEGFGSTLNDKEIIVLDIPDEYQYMDEDLIKELKEVIDYYFLFSDE